ncbi:MAG TPA: DUF1800 family protein, partial [Vicinamibacterales bacterium]|nr:DUF1800 family protein [Vicinamibacterales bacterium]
MRIPARLLVVAVSATVTAAASSPKSAVPANPDDKTILHVLNRIGFGARPGDVERIRQIGLAAYIDQQLHPERIADKGVNEQLAGYETLTKNSRQIAQEYYAPAQKARQAAKKNSGETTQDRPQLTPEEMKLQRKMREPLIELSEQKIVRAAYSDRQLEEVMTDFWFNHFNVFANKGPEQEYLTSYERDVIRPHALGKFRDLLEATAKSPAMLFYLDNWQSVDPNGVHPANNRAATARGFGRGGIFGPRFPPQQNPN